jgi:integrase
MLALFSGMRRGEIFQLTWNDIDFVNNIINIRAETTKTKTSRQIPLATELKAHLLEVKIKTRSIRVISDYTFLHKISRVWHDHRYKLSCNKVNGLDLRFHDLRHVFGQRLLEKGVDILDIQQWLGHSSVKMTQKRYVNIQRRTNFDKINVLNFQGSSHLQVNDVSQAQ